MVKSKLLLVLLLATNLICGPAQAFSAKAKKVDAKEQAAVTASDAQKRSENKADPDSAEGRKALSLETERAFVSKHPKVFQRSGKTLTVTVNGKKREFVDVEAEGDKAVLHYVAGYVIKNEVVVIRRQFWEGGDFLVISRNSGAELSVSSLPQWSPTQAYFISVNHDESDYTESEVMIGECNQKTCDDLWNKSDRTTNAKWLGHNKVKYDVLNFDPGTGVTSIRETVTCEIKEEISCKAEKR